MESISKPNQQTNVLLVTVAAQGHVNPMLRLGNLLVSKGLHVTLATHDYALKHGSSNVGSIHLEFFSDGLPKDYNLFYNLTSGLPSFNADELPSFVLPSNTFTTFDSILKEAFHNLHKVKWVLGNSFMELENDVITSTDKFWPVGPLVPESLFGKMDKVGGDLSGFDTLKSDNDSIDCLKWLDKQQPASVVYVSFGSLVYYTEKQLESIASGLKQANRPFIWVVKIAENKENKEFGVFEEIKELGLVVKWSPQTAVLSHPSVGCFLSHCGWNSLVESITAGVPVIACPLWSDQPTNAKLVTDVWKVGVKVEKDSEGFFVGEEVARCVDEIMSGPRSEEFRKNAVELKRAAREAVVDDGSSDKNIQLFVDEVVCYCET
ncbi:hypothetical protein M8C21_014308 [Ambrosia artemisiifolia]|uniref:Glycosyltransferase n=1 Tax=Ambrosia artemisiifolia TaxID=4212 RepID=A0AAD5CLQ7_AMBAR|nr:hypothetical protein M8C21_014308 [Ambrosia artemisiifolia]